LSLEAFVDDCFWIQIAVSIPHYLKQRAQQQYCYKHKDLYHNLNIEELREGSLLNIFDAPPYLTEEQQVCCYEQD